jgi:hypothetical protein
MKKLGLSIAVLLIASMSYGQFHFGPQIGFAGSNLSLDVDSIKNNLKSNFLVGVFMRFGQKIYVQPEVNWLTQGSVFKYPSLNNLSPIEQTVKLSTIQVPVNIGWRMINLKVVNVRIFAGIAANFVVNKNVTTSGDEQNFDGTLPTEDDFKNTIWQWDAGAGVDVLMFALDVKYVGGLNNIFNDFQFNPNTKTITSKSSLFVVTLGWKIM